MKTRNVGLRIITATFICHSSSSKCTEWRLMSPLPPWDRGLGPGIALAGNDVEDDIGRVKALRSPSRRQRRTTIKLGLWRRSRPTVADAPLVASSSRRADE